jgi:NADH:ubiquinone oxidoreductase subunit 5 (subunit L)/multisubunit Na+/H+ antiporter MnhA subunit
MSMTLRELVTALHGMVLGAGFLLAFSGGWVALRAIGSNGLTADGRSRLHRRMAALLWTMTILAWLAVLLGTWVIYPWYRAKPPAGAGLGEYPKYLLLSNPHTADWHEFGMEWKEHVAWLAPILAAAVAFVATRHRDQLAADPVLRRTVLFLYGVCFFAAAVAGGLGALIDKAGPIR